MLCSSGNPENGELYIGLLCLLGNPEKVSKLSPLSDLEAPKRPAICIFIVHLGTQKMAVSCISFVDWDNCLDFHSPSISFCQTKEKKEEGEGEGVQNRLVNTRLCYDAHVMLYFVWQKL